MEIRPTARDWETRLRLIAAAVLGFFQLLSMVYYGSGLISPEAMTAVYRAQEPILLLFPAFGAALFLHMGLGLAKLYRRNTLRMPLWEASQIALGLSIPLLMLAPSLALAALDWKFGLPGTNPDALLVTYPETAWRSIALTLVIGLHALIGTHALLRMRPWYPRVRVLIFASFAVFPLAAALGYLQSGALAVQTAPQTLTADQLLFYRECDLVFCLAIVALYGLLFAARSLRQVGLSSKRTATVVYADGSRVDVAPSTTILEASRIGGVPHPSICGGRGRCTTCRVRVDAGMDNLSPVGEREQKALTRIGADADIRLACQAECRGGAATVTILLPAHIQPREARRETRDSVGRDVALAVMFVDMRGFTALADQKFPYDVVYILNNYFQAMGEEIAAHGGTVDKFLGDGILAYFGLGVEPRDACRAAVLAAKAMAARLVALNQRLLNVVPEGLTIGIAIHFGDVILGEIGSNEKRQLTIIGSTVNTASRLEGVNKRATSQLVLTTQVAALAGADLSQTAVASVVPRGNTEVLRVYVVKDVLKELAEFA
jgi:adenylate cyclase